MAKPRIAIVGAGFAGLAASRQLSRLPRQEADVHLFDRNASTTMLPALPDVAGGRLEPARIHADLRQLLKPHIQLHLETVQSVDPAKKTLSTAEGVFTYDFLVLTCGAVPDRRGLDEHQEAAYTLGSLADAERICQDFTAYVQSRSSPQVLVVGGGYTGLELASNLKLRSVRLGRPARVTVLERKDRFLAGLPDRIRAYLEKQALRQGIEIRTVVKVDSFDGRNVRLSDGSCHDEVFLCCSTGTRRGLPELQGEKQELPDGRIVVDEYLRIPQHPQIFVAGDAAAILHRDVPLRKAVNFAYYSGQSAGRNILLELRGKPLQAFRPLDLGWVIPFGSTAAGQVLGIDYLAGRLPLAMHYAMCGYRNFTLGNKIYFAKSALRALFGML
ncbi:MAG: FAD-dependent oxidoreductase [Lentisphaeria bacterium]|nr:FAD-dependent oxidoreductase [Lentisphaeria bacterium]